MEQQLVNLTPFDGAAGMQPQAAVSAADAMDATVLDCGTELMLRVKQGDAPSLGVLLNQHRTSVIRFLYRMVQEPLAAEELAQEVFVRVYRARSAYQPSAKFTTWLFRIARHLALNWLRDGRNLRAQERLDDSPDGFARGISNLRPTAEQHLLNQAKVQEVRRAIAALPEKQRAALLMHKYQEIEYSQIAKILRCSESAVKSLLSRAYEMLRFRLSHLR